MKTKKNYNKSLQLQIFKICNYVKCYQPIHKLFLIPIPILKKPIFLLHDFFIGKKQLSINNATKISKIINTSLSYFSNLKYFTI